MTELFLKLINMSIAASWLVLAVLLLRPLFRKAPKWVNVLFWGIVAVRLICPFSFESALSLIPSAETFPDKVISGPSFDIQTGIAPVDNRINDYLGDRYFEGVTVPANNGNNVMTILTIVWIIGILLLVAYTIISYRRLHREIDTAVRYKDNIFQSENVSSPFVLGIIKPRIYLPFNMNGQELAHVVAHEQAHIHRKDHWWKPLGFLLLTIHWFNPLMWLAYVLLCRDIELACDEKVIKELGNAQRADYTQALVACSVNRRMISACPLAFGEVGVKARVKSVMNYKKPAFWVIVLAVVTCAVVAVCFLTNPAGTALTKWTIDGIDMRAALEDVRSMTVRYYGDSVSCSDGDSSRFIATMGKIKVGRSPVSQSRDESRDQTFAVMINDQLTLNFAEDFSEVWFDDGVKPSFSYPVSNPETAEELLLDFHFTRNGAEYPGNVETEDTDTDVYEDRIFVPSETDVLERRAMVLEGMSESEIFRLTDFIKAANLKFERAWFYNDIFGQLRDPENVYWTYFDRTGEIQIGSAESDGETSAVLAYNDHDADFFISVISELKESIVSGMLDDDMDKLIDLCSKAKETHDVEYAMELYHMLHDLDYFLLRYGPSDVGRYVTDASTLSKYYGSLQIWQAYEN